MSNVEEDKRPQVAGVSGQDDRIAVDGEVTGGDTFADVLKSWSADAEEGAPSDSSRASSPADRATPESVSAYASPQYQAPPAYGPGSGSQAPSTPHGYYGSQGAPGSPYPGQAPYPQHGAPQSGYSAPAQPSGYPGQPDPAYAAPAYPGPAYPGPAYPGAGYPGAGYPGAAHPGAGYAAPGQPAAGYASGHAPTQDWNPHAGPPNQQWAPQGHYPPAAVPERRGIPTHLLASRSRRLAGSILDGLFTLLIVMPFLMIGIFLTDGSPVDDDTLTAVMMLSLIAGMFFSIAINAYLITKYGKTLAKFPLGMKILRTDGSSVDFKRGVLMRWLAPGFAAGVIPGFQFVDGAMIFANDRNQTLHDVIADTQVVND